MYDRDIIRRILREGLNLFKPIQWRNNKEFLEKLFELLPGNLTPEWDTGVFGINAWIEGRDGLLFNITQYQGEGGSFIVYLENAIIETIIDAEIFEGLTIKTMDEILKYITSKLNDLEK